MQAIILTILMVFLSGCTKRQDGDDLKKMSWFIEKKHAKTGLVKVHASFWTFRANGKRCIYSLLDDIETGTVIPSLSCD